MTAERTPTQMGKHARRKGAQFERELANSLRDWLESKGYDPGEDLKRGIGQARQSHEVPDVAGFYPLWIEAKKHRTCTPKVAYQQAETDLQEHIKRHPEAGYSIPVAITSDNRDKALITLSLDDFLFQFFLPFLEKEQE